MVHRISIIIRPRGILVVPMFYCLPTPIESNILVFLIRLCCLVMLSICSIVWLRGVLNSRRSSLGLPLTPSGFWRANTKNAWREHDFFSSSPWREDESGLEGAHRLHSTFFRKTRYLFTFQRYCELVMILIQNLLSSFANHQFLPFNS